MLNLIRIQRLSSDAVLPSKGTRDSTGYDLASNEDTIINPGERILVGTGLVMDLSRLMPEVDVQIRPRSGLAAKNGITVLNSPGTIDRDYRGEIKVILINHGDSSFVIHKGDRIAQMVFALAFPLMTFLPVETVDENTERGAGGIGSTGVKSAKPKNCCGGGCHNHNR